MGYLHFGHRDHPLVICSKAADGQARCAACDDMCTGLTYGCKGCSFYLHYSCLLLEEILHPAHPSHSLVPRPVSADFTCSACRRSQSNGFCFLCPETGCSFAIDVKCAFPLPAIYFPGHGHRLHFFGELPEDVDHRQCEACGEPCRSAVLGCLDLGCKFGVHLVCERPLCLFEHEVWRTLPGFHCPNRNGLQLKASIDKVDDRRRRPCRYCSKEIGPQTPLYHCDFCKLIAHVECIFSRVDRGEDLQMIHPETKQDGRKEGNSESKEAAMQHGETFRRMVDSLNKKEEAELEDVYRRRVVEIIKVLAWRKNARGSSDGVPKSPFLDEAFSEFRKRLPHDIRRMTSLAVASEDEMVRPVAEYKMTWKLAPVLKKLFTIHGDLSEESNLSRKPKNLVFVMLCGTIYSMDSTKVAEVTEELLYNWWKYLMFVHLSRFKIEFAIDRLKLVMRAHYNLRHDNNAILRMAIEIRELSQEIQESKSKLDRLRDEHESMLEDEHGSTLNVTEDLVEACSKNARAWKY
ncbi:uncharacterized protein LOC115743130 [Rhodamnia argentea]|uniref:Uncharacterized protein LOC115743130 n=1 Tax=Rhodamnia argentea TaxID=178133 RepID=A0A8B8PG16_9MYRT|nr:uncharacterized protein LOC115743130 [Rhodamnia argentea]